VAAGLLCKDLSARKHRPSRRWLEASLEGGRHGMAALFMPS